MMPSYDDDHKLAQGRRLKSKSVQNPLQAGILKFTDGQRPPVTIGLGKIPKRYTRYGSLLLLGPTFTTYSVEWSDIYDSLTDAQKQSLFRCIVQAFGDESLSHVAINAPIMMTRESISGEISNEMRLPTGLDPVYGDFGPASEFHLHNPSKLDLEAAYWTSTAVLNNIQQVWAPRYSMYSRGNITEKSRILQDGTSKSVFPGMTELELGETLAAVDVVDFYVGIGYFAFCYLSRGARRVWGWDINGWSIEGLRRGCRANGWEVRVVRIGEEGMPMNSQSIGDLAKEIQDLEGTPQEIRCIAFWGHNQWAAKVLDEIKSAMLQSGRQSSLNIRQCNLGLLPSSEDSWEGAIKLVNPQKGGWLHIHENVQLSAIETKKTEILHRLHEILQSCKQGQWITLCDHVEQVKTYAPGVMHCVYDMKIYPSS